MIRSKIIYISIINHMSTTTVFNSKLKFRLDNLKEVFKLIDEINDGFIDFEEFLEWWQECWWEY